MSKQVIVIGAGIAGLSAAWRLQRHGCRVLVLEAGERPGGRMSTDLRDGYRIDRGAQFLSSGYEVINSLVAAMGLASTLDATTQCSGIARGGRVRVFDPARPWTLARNGLLGWGQLLRLALSTGRGTRATRHLPLNDYAAWHAWDTEPTAGWLARHAGRDALEYLFEPMLEGFYFQDPESTSMALSMLVSGYGARGHRTVTLRGGMGGLTGALAAGLDVRLASRALAVSERPDGITVQTAAGALHADHIVLATTASAARALYQPDCPATRAILATDYSATINIGIAVPGGIATPMVADRVYGLLLPRSERRTIAAVGIESRKSRGAVPQGELLNVMLDGKAGARLVDQPEHVVLAEVLPELEHYFPGVSRTMAFAHFCRWREAEPRSPVGRSRAIGAYRAACRPGQRIVLAGDYLSAPTTEGAAASGLWAADLLLGQPGARS